MFYYCLYLLTKIKRRMGDSDCDIVEDDRRLYMKVDENYDKIEACEGDEEIVEYLDLDMEVMEEVEESDYFARVRPSQGDIYIRQKPSSSPQVLTVIHSSTDYETTKQTQQLTDHNGTAKVLWSKSIPVLDDTKVCTTTNARSLSVRNSNSKIRRKRKEYNEENFVDNNDSKNENKEYQVQSRNDGDSLDLFFQSMAQTVLQLPAQAQAAIKMEICKVISTAEIKYCTTESVMEKN